MIGHLLHWLYGNVYGNLVANVIWAAPALWHLHRKLDRHHAAQLEAAHSAAGMPAAPVKDPAAPVSCNLQEKAAGE